MHDENLLRDARLLVCASSGLGPRRRVVPLHPERCLYPEVLGSDEHDPATNRGVVPLVI